MANTDYPNAHEHTHESGGTSGHSHTHTNTKTVINRMNRAIGHMEAVRNMVRS